MAGLEGFPPGPSLYWDQKVPTFVEGDPRRPTTLDRKGKKVIKGYQPEEILESGDGESDKYAGMGIGVTGLLAENLACHPFVILRRQCQVNVESRRHHTTPLTLLPVLVNLNRWQGVAVLWKGIGSSLTIKGMSLGVEDCLSKVTPWPKEIDKHSSLKMIGQHLLLKCASTAIITPFYSASLVECVQSDIASEKPGILDVFRDGIARLVSWSDPRCGRMLPVWVLIPPQIIHSISHYIISTVVQGVWLQVLKATHREYQKLTGAVSKDPQLGNLPGLSQYQTQAAALAGHFVADSLLYPLETVLHRLHLQGTRSIIDNLDSGIEVVPILTRYEGVSDCFSTILQEEGFTGLFKGFGAVLLQYAVHFLIIKFSSKIITQVAQVFSNPKLFPADPRLPAVPDVTPDMSASASATSSLRGSPKLGSLRESAPSGSPASVKPVPSLGPGSSSFMPERPGVLGLDREPKDAHEEGISKEEHVNVDKTKSVDLGLPPLFNPKPSGPSGLPPLLSFSNTSPQRRILPDRDYDHYNKNWKSMDTL